MKNYKYSNIADVLLPEFFQCFGAGGSPPSPPICPCLGRFRGTKNERVWQAKERDSPKRGHSARGAECCPSKATFDLLINSSTS